MKIYTGTGDGGKTSLFSGERIKKNDIRVAAYGTVDELCSYLGVIAAVLPECEKREIFAAELQKIQADLFTIGAILATATDSPDISLLQPLPKDKIQWLEKKIDIMQTELEELRSFILPGGHISSAWAQVARTICRRAERKIISLEEQHGCIFAEEVICYINRLSDYFFVLARLLNKLSNVSEITWHG